MIILTGASSFVGRNFLSNLKNKTKLVCLVRKKILNLGARQELVDFQDKENLEKYINKSDTIIHIAGITNGKKKDIFSINYNITKNLVDAGKKKKIKRFIFISSVAAVVEDSGNYGKSKLMAEEYIKKSGINYIILRPSMIYGKGEKKFIGRILNLIKKSNIVPVIGNGKYPVNIVYVKDTAKIIEKAIDLNRRNMVYYVSDGKGLSMNEICRIGAENLDKKIILIHIPVSFLKVFSGFVRLFAKDFPEKEQFDRITRHKKYPVKETEKDFNIKFSKFEDNIKEMI